VQAAGHVVRLKVLAVIISNKAEKKVEICFLGELYQHKHAESESQPPTQFAEHSGIRNSTEQAVQTALIKRNNTNEMIPENNTGKEDEAVKRIHNISITKQGKEPDDHERTTTETLECISTDKLDR
jgi:hypothetical protein